MNQPEKISRMTGVLMIVVAGTFDLVQFATGIILLFASKMAVLVGWIPFIGQFFAGKILMAAGALQGIIGWGIIGIGYLTITFWILLKGVPLIKGGYAARRFSTLIATAVIDFMPVLNVLPGLFIWTTVQVYFIRKDEKEVSQKAQASENTERVQRRYIRQEAL